MRATGALVTAAVALVCGIAVVHGSGHGDVDVEIDRAIAVEDVGTVSPDAVDAVVAVVARRCGDITAGSGFRLGDDLVVTASHLTGAGTALQVTDGRGVWTTAPGRVAASSDLAVAEGASIFPGLRLATADPEPGTAVTVMGVERSGRVALTAGTVTARGRAPDYGLTGLDLLVVDAGVPPGHSGGPVVDAQGHVVGVIAAGEAHTGTTLVTPVSELRSLVDSVSTTPEPEAC